MSNEDMAAPQAASTIANLMLRRSEVVDAPDLGANVVIREAKVGDVLPYLATAQTDPQAFMKRMLAASLEIDGERLSVDDFDNLPMSKFRSIQKLLPRIQSLNGIEPGSEEDASKND